LHALFNINCDNKFKDLEDGPLKILQELFRHTLFIIIDEYSMLSQTMLSKIDFRLRQIKQRHNLYFGGLSIILTGDPVQLPAVAAPALYSKALKNQIDTNGYNAYLQFKIVVKFEQVMRQQVDNNPDQIHFVDLLTRFRNGDCTIDDWKLLCKRFPDSKTTEEFKDAPRLFPENAPCDKFNIERITTINQPIVDLHAFNEPKSVRKYDSDTFNGLQNLIYLCPEASVVITNNIWKRKGILNGANATIKAILFDDNREPTQLPHTIVIHCPGYTGPQLFQEPERHNWVPINPFTQWSKTAKGTRTQMPFRLAYAMTVHKSQGQTMEKGVIDFTESERNLGSAYVQITRFKHINNFLVKPFSFARITTNIKKSKSFIPRQNEEIRLKKLTDSTLLLYMDLLDL
jgi:ATP-dependent DNA helicase PIF1